MKDDLETEYTSVDLAYKLAVESYGIAIKRFDAIDDKIKSLITVALTVILAIPVFKIEKMVVSDRDLGIAGKGHKSFGSYFMILRMNQLQVIADDVERRAPTP